MARNQVLQPKIMFNGKESGFTASNEVSQQAIKFLSKHSGF
jgi:hypothetical protein